MYPGIDPKIGIDFRKGRCGDPTFPAINGGYQQKARALSLSDTARACFSP